MFLMQRPTTICSVATCSPSSNMVAIPQGPFDPLDFLRLNSVYEAVSVAPNEASLVPSKILSLPMGFLAEFVAAMSPGCPGWGFAVRSWVWAALTWNANLAGRLKVCGSNWWQKKTHRIPRGDVDIIIKLVFKILVGGRESRYCVIMYLDSIWFYYIDMGKVANQRRMVISKVQGKVIRLWAGTPAQFELRCHVRPGWAKPPVW